MKNRNANLNHFQSQGGLFENDYAEFDESREVVNSLIEEYKVKYTLHYCIFMIYVFIFISLLFLFKISVFSHLFPLSFSHYEPSLNRPRKHPNILVMGWRMIIFLMDRQPGEGGQAAVENGE